MTPIPGSGSLNGTVIDSVSGVGVAGVYISIGDRKTRSDANGNYKFRHANPGTYNLTAAKHGYRGYTDSVRVNAGAGTTYNFQIIQGN
jgi:protocatechuate 3,4-dioxygenase beta subunit